MIYVNEKQLNQVKYLLEQSAQGIHLLFDAGTIRRVANKPEEKLRTEKAEKILEQMILCPSISSKKAFLESLDRESYDDVARVYFNIVQNNALENQGFAQ